MKIKNDDNLEDENFSHNDDPSDFIKDKDCLKFSKFDEKDNQSKVKTSKRDEVDKKLSEQNLRANKSIEKVPDALKGSNPGKLEEVSIDEQIEWMTAKSLDKSKHIKYWKILAKEKANCLDKYIQKNKELKKQLESSELELQLIEAEIQHWNKICQDGFEFASQIENMISQETQ